MNKHAGCRSLVIIGAMATAWFWLVPVTSADTIYLKDQQTIEGTVTGETAESVSIDVGCGTVQFLRTQIERIDRNTTREPSAALPPSSTPDAVTVPAELSNEVRSLNMLMTQARKSRATVTRWSEERKRVERTLRAIEDKVLPLYKQYELVNAEMERSSQKQRGTAGERKQAITTYARYNTLTAQISEAQVKSEAIERELSSLDTHMGEALGVFNRDVSAVAKAYRALVKKSPQAKELPALKSIAATIERFKSEWVVNDIPLVQQGNNYLTEVAINGKPAMLLMVDTGASLVCLSRNLATKAGLTERDEVRTLTMTLADGKTVEGKMVYLKTVKVGNMEEERVPAVILDQTPSQEADGLLGMSFLERYFFKLDVKRKKLILEKFQG